MVLCFYKTFGFRCSWDFGPLAYDAWLKVFGLGPKTDLEPKTIGLSPSTNLKPMTIGLGLETIGLRPKTFVLRAGIIGLGRRILA